MDDGPILPIPDPENRPSIEEVLNEIQEQPWYKNQIVDKRTVPAKEGQTGEFVKSSNVPFLTLCSDFLVDIELSATIRQALRDSRGIESFYTHQASAINAISQNKDVIVSTPTASGKSVIYQVPLLKFLEENRNATAIFVYPTKVCSCLSSL
jgi:DEAD/DEAH box helicase domain-containing protein